MTQEEFIALTVEINKTQSQMNAAGKIKDCFFHDANECVSPIINAHSLQRQGALKNLEKEVEGNLVLYSHTERQINKEHNFVDLKPIGRKVASTFFGFCSFHDTHLFSKIENDPEVTDINSDEHCFLHSYRSFAHSYHRKYEEHKLFTSTDETTHKLLLKKYGRAGIKGNLEAIEMALNDLKKPKELMGKWMRESSYDQLEYLCFEYPYRIPVACAACTSPSHSYSGKVINISPDPNYVYSNVITTVIPFKNRSIIILAVFEHEPKGVVYLDEIDNIKHELLQQKFLSYHLINNAENCYVSPHFYDSKEISWKANYCRMIDFIANRTTPFMKFRKNFPFNYFSELEAIG